MSTNTANKKGKKGSSKVKETPKVTDSSSPKADKPATDEVPAEAKIASMTVKAPSPKKKEIIDEPVTDLSSKTTDETKDEVTPAVEDDEREAEGDEKEAEGDEEGDGPKARANARRRRAAKKSTGESKDSKEEEKRDWSPSDHDYTTVMIYSALALNPLVVWARGHTPTLQKSVAFMTVHLDTEGKETYLSVGIIKQGLYDTLIEKYSERSTANPHVQPLEIKDYQLPKDYQCRNWIISLPPWHEDMDEDMVKKIVSKKLELMVKYGVLPKKCYSIDVPLASRVKDGVIKNHFFVKFDATVDIDALMRAKLLLKNTTWPSDDESEVHNFRIRWAVDAAVIAKKSEKKSPNFKNNSKGTSGASARSAVETLTPKKEAKKFDPKKVPIVTSSPWNKLPGPPPPTVGVAVHKVPAKGAAVSHVVATKPKIVEEEEYLFDV